MSRIPQDKIHTSNFKIVYIEIEKQLQAGYYICFGMASTDV